MLSGPPASATVTADQLLERFLSASTRQRRSLVTQLEARLNELRPLLIDRLAGLDANGDDWAPGALIHWLLSEADALAADFRGRYPQGWLETPTGSGIDYQPLQVALSELAFEQADRHTSSILR